MLEFKIFEKGRLRWLPVAEVGGLSLWQSSENTDPLAPSLPKSIKVLRHIQKSIKACVTL